jgi:hypothetical protein
MRPGARAASTRAVVTSSTPASSRDYPIRAGYSRQASRTSATNTTRARELTHAAKTPGFGSCGGRAVGTCAARATAPDGDSSLVAVMGASWGSPGTTALVGAQGNLRLYLSAASGIVELGRTAGPPDP